MKRSDIGVAALGTQLGSFPGSLATVDQEEIYEQVTLRKLVCTPKSDTEGNKL